MACGRYGVLTATMAALSVAMPLTASASEDAAELAAVRAATERFQDVNVALSEGYVPDPSGMCITADMEGFPAHFGAMGIHYLRPDLLKITGTSPRVDGMSTHTDFKMPAVLLYEPQADGGLVLVGVESLVFEKAWAEAGNASPPAYLGNSFVHMVDDPDTPADEAHGFEPHYELHVWLYRENPGGMFTPFNTKVTCEHHVHMAR